MNITLPEFVELYQNLRKAQQAYFDQRKADNSQFSSKEAKAKLAYSKLLESELDTIARTISAVPQS